MVLAVVGAVGMVSFLINGFAHTVAGLGWLEKFSAFSWGVGHEPVTQGVDVAGLVVLGGACAVLLIGALVVYGRRDLRL